MHRVDNIFRAVLISSLNCCLIFNNKWNRIEFDGQINQKRTEYYKLIGGKFYSKNLKVIRARIKSIHLRHAKEWINGYLAAQKEVDLSAWFLHKLIKVQFILNINTFHSMTLFLFANSPLSITALLRIHFELPKLSYFWPPTNCRPKITFRASEKRTAYVSAHRHMPATKNK